MEAEDGSALAGPARAVRPLVHGGLPLPALTAGGDLGPSLCRGAAGGGPGRTGGLDAAVRGRYGHPGAPARRGGQKRGAETEALGRSQGGYSTKVHLQCEGGGTPLTVVLTPGQDHEAPVFDRLLGQGAIKRPGRGRPRWRPHLWWLPR
jgi:hypothetical protein